MPLPMLTATTTCEQVKLVGTTHALGGRMDVFQECSEDASHRVEWNNVDCQPTEMFMCTMHKDDFLLDTEGDPDITYTYVQEL
jgi:hypothetical protein